MSYPLPLTRTEAYLAYKAGVIQQSDLKPSLAVPRNGIDAWLAYWTGLAADYPKKPTVNLFDKNKITVGVRVSTSNGGTYPKAGYAISSFIPVSPLTTYVLVCGTAAGGSFFSWYDSSKHYISGSGWQNKRAWESPANARYIKFDFKESEKDIVQFEKAPLSPYSPYTNEPLILQEEEAYIAYLCGVINEYPEKCLRRVGAYLRYLISSRWGRPDHPLNREELYLSLIKTQFIPSGDPSSDIVIEGTAKAPFVDVRLYGDTLQQGNTAKSLLNTKSETEETDEEIKTAIPDDKTIELEATETPTVKAAVKSEAKIEAGYDEIATPTVEEDSTAISYEKSTSVQSNPSPDSPQPIQTVTGEQTVSIIGKNLFDKDTPLSNKYIDASGNWITGQAIYIVQEYKAIPSSTYSFSFSNKVGSAYIRFAEYDSGGNFTKRTLVDTTNTTLTLRSDTHKIAWSIDARMDAGAYSTYFTDLQIEVGTTATTYVPYNPRDYKINLGKNLFDKNNASLLLDGLYIGSTNMQSSNQTASLYIPCEPNTTYTVSKDSTARFACATTAELPANGVSVANRIGDNTAASITITTSSTAKYLVVFYYHSSYDTKPKQQILDSIQIEVGSTATTYAPYFEPIELCKLGTYQDYIWKDGDDWKVHKATKAIYLKDITWLAAPTSVTGKYRMRTSTAPDDILEPTDNNTKAVIKSSVYDVITAGDTYAARATGISVQATTPHIFIYDPDYNTASSPTAFTQKMASTNATAYYALATATDTTITNQALIDQLEALVKGGSEDGATYIKVNATDPNLPGLLYVEAPKYE